MSEWWAYTLSDFLMFSPQTYYRLFALYNREVWPAQLAAVAAGIALLPLLHRGGGAASRAIAALLALGWLWVAWAFLLQHYDTINLAGRYFAAGFVAEALLIGISGLAAGRVRFGPVEDAAARIGLGIFLFAFIGYPLVAMVAGRPWDQAELFGLAPDPTAIGTLGLLLACRWHAAWPLALLPVIWCMVSGATLWTMQASEALLPAGAALLAVVAAIYRRTRASWHEVSSQ